MAMILRRLGKTVAMLEKGKHPRFAIGESSTPLANLLLEEIASQYDLPDLAPFSKWGAWQKAHPEVGCGLKRGFTFYKHQFGKPLDFTDRTQQLLVAASPNDRIADTHWYRRDFDAHLAKQAQSHGVELVENARFELSPGWRALGDGIDLQADFLIDASGPRGSIFQHFKMQEASWQAPRTHTEFAHFENVRRLDPSGDLPYPADDAALHHVFDSGWIWVLRFNNGITSAGIITTDPNLTWNSALEKLPTVRWQFENARPTTPFFKQRTVAFRAQQGVGENWAMLPSAMGFVDPLFSTGFVLTLLGIRRLAEVFEGRRTPAEYERQSFQELDFTATLIRRSYEAFGDFPKFTSIARIYFAAAIWAETLRRLGRTPPAFLLADNAEFQDANFDPGKVPALLAKYDLGGLADSNRQNWHPALASDLFASAHKIPATRNEIESMLRRSGFTPDPASA